MIQTLLNIPALTDRAAGILLHPTSLPGPYGVGDVGPSAFEFVEFLRCAGQRWWQILPIGPAGWGNSPYSAFSAFAGSPLLISPHTLRQENLITSRELSGAPSFPKTRVDYDKSSAFKQKLFAAAFGRFSPTEEFNEFVQAQARWLDDFALFSALKERHGGKSWTTWEAPLRQRDRAALAAARQTLENEVRYHNFLQYQFHRQWGALKERCRSKGIGLIGDLPLFVSHDSADVWAHPQFFRLNADGTPSVVAGVPPDMFSGTGQRWGNPLYNWERLAGDRYAWWVERFKKLFETFDAVRLDHFIGFHRFWEIPGEERTAVKGKYILGPGAAFFQEILRRIPRAAFIAEDLGAVVPEVTALRDQFQLPGMNVLQFAFSGDPKFNTGLPHKFNRNSVVYTGTHDNDTTAGWFKAGTSAEERKFIRTYLGGATGEIHWDMIRLAFGSVARTAIIPMQDILGLGTEARMNFPGTSEGNWRWRMKAGAATRKIEKRLRRLSETYGRTL